MRTKRKQTLVEKAFKPQVNIKYNKRPEDFTRILAFTPRIQTRHSAAPTYCPVVVIVVDVLVLVSGMQNLSDTHHMTRSFKHRKTDERQNASKELFANLPGLDFSGQVLNPIDDHSGFDYQGSRAYCSGSGGQSR